MVALWREHEGGGSETTSVFDARLEELEVALTAHVTANEEQLGSVTSHVAFVMDVERLIPEYRMTYHDWIATDPAGRSDVDMTAWAEHAITRIRLDKMPTEYELRKHVHALGSLAGYSPQRRKETAKSIWRSSMRSTPASQPIPEGRVASPFREGDVGNNAASVSGQPHSGLTPSPSIPAGSPGQGHAGMAATTYQGQGPDSGSCP